MDLAPGELFYTMPQVLPGGNDVLVTIYSTPPGLERAVIDVISLRDRQPKDRCPRRHGSTLPAERSSDLHERQHDVCGSL